MVLPKEHNSRNPLFSKHFLLSLALLAALLITEVMVFTLIDADSRKDMLGLVFGAFGAWIGASAAYFFGRENMRTATESMLRMRGRSAAEILATTSLRNMRPRPIPRVFGLADRIGDVLTWLEAKRERAFAVVLGADEKFQCAVDEEALYRFINRQMKEAKTDYPSACQAPLSAVISAFQASRDLKPLVEAAIAMRQDASAYAANEKMAEAKVFVTIVLDNENRPTGYITTEDIRELVLSVPSA